MRIWNLWWIWLYRKFWKKQRIWEEQISKKSNRFPRLVWWWITYWTSSYLLKHVILIPKFREKNLSFPTQILRQAQHDTAPNQQHKNLPNFNYLLIKEEFINMRCLRTILISLCILFSLQQSQSQEKTFKNFITQSGPKLTDRDQISIRTMSTTKKICLLQRGLRLLAAGIVWKW